MDSRINPVFNRFSQYPAMQGSFMQGYTPYSYMPSSMPYSYMPNPYYMPPSMVNYAAPQFPNPLQARMNPLSQMPPTQYPFPSNPPQMPMDPALFQTDFMALTEMQTTQFPFPSNPPQMTPPFPQKPPSPLVQTHEKEIKIQKTEPTSLQASTASISQEFVVQPEEKMELPAPSTPNVRRIATRATSIGKSAGVIPLKKEPRAKRFKKVASEPLDDLDHLCSSVQTQIKQGFNDRKNKRFQEASSHFSEAILTLEKNNELQKDFFLSDLRHNLFDCQCALWEQEENLNDKVSLLGVAIVSLQKFLVNSQDPAKPTILNNFALKVLTHADDVFIRSEYLHAYTNFIKVLHLDFEFKHLIEETLFTFIVNDLFAKMFQCICEIMESQDTIPDNMSKEFLRLLSEKGSCIDEETRTYYVDSLDTTFEAIVLPVDGDEAESAPQLPVSKKRKRDEKEVDGPESKKSKSEAQQLANLND